MAEFTDEMAQAALQRYLADWVQQLRFELTDMRPNGAQFLWHVSAEVCRPSVKDEPGVLCGQAIMTAADTLCVAALVGLNDGFRNCTTIDLHCNFMRPLFEAPVEVDITALSNGRRTATMRVEFRQQGSPKLAAQATAAFMYLE